MIVKELEKDACYAEMQAACDRLNEFVEIVNGNPGMSPSELDKACYEYKVEILPFGLEDAIAVTMDIYGNEYKKCVPNSVIESYWS